MLPIQYQLSETAKLKGHSLQTYHRQSSDLADIINNEYGHLSEEIGREPNGYFKVELGPNPGYRWEGFSTELNKKLFAVHEGEDQIPQ